MRPIPKLLAVVLVSVGCFIAAVAVSEELKCNCPYKDRMLTHKELTTVLRNHQTWIKSGRNCDCNLKADLRQANLRNADLQGTDLSDSNLQGAELCGARLKKANLFNANLKEANLFRANFVIAGDKST